MTRQLPHVCEFDRPPQETLFTVHLGFIGDLARCRPEAYNTMQTADTRLQDAPLMTEHGDEAQVCA